MSAWFYKKGNALVPEDPDSLKRIKPGEAVRVSVTRPRHLRWFRRYWAICRDIGQNQDPERDEGSIDQELRIRSGHFEVLMMDGHEVRVPQRINFAKLSQQQWEELWPRMELAICERFGVEYLEERAA